MFSHTFVLQPTREDSLRTTYSEDFVSDLMTLAGSSPDQVTELLPDHKEKDGRNYYAETEDDLMIELLTENNPAKTPLAVLTGEHTFAFLDDAPVNYFTAQLKLFKQWAEEFSLMDMLVDPYAGKRWALKELLDPTYGPLFIFQDSCWTFDDLIRRNTTDPYKVTQIFTYKF